MVWITIDQLNQMPVTPYILLKRRRRDALFPYVVAQEITTPGYPTVFTYRVNDDYYHSDEVERWFTHFSLIVSPTIQEDQR